MDTGNRQRVLLSGPECLFGPNVFINCIMMEGLLTQPPPWIDAEILVGSVIAVSARK